MKSSVLISFHCADGKTQQLDIANDVIRKICLTLDVDTALRLTLAEREALVKNIIEQPPSKLYSAKVNTCYNHNAFHSAFLFRSNLSRDLREANGCPYAANFDAACLFMTCSLVACFHSAYLNAACLHAAYLDANSEAILCEGKLLLI
jgi:hypothetical protein